MLLRFLFPSLLHWLSIFKMAAVHNLGCLYFRNISQKFKLAPISTRQAKFGEDRAIRSRVIAYFRFSKWRPSAILDLVWRHCGPPTICVWWLRWSCLYFARYREFYMRPVWLEIAYSCRFGGVFGRYKWIPILSQPLKRPSLGKTRAVNGEYLSTGSTWVRAQGKIQYNK